MKVKAPFDTGIILVNGREVPVTGGLAEVDEADWGFLERCGYKPILDSIPEKSKIKSVLGAWPSRDGKKLIRIKPKLDLMFFFLTSHVGGTEKRLAELIRRLNFRMHLFWKEEGKGGIFDELKGVKNVVSVQRYTNSKRFLKYCISKDVDIIFFFGTALPATIFHNAGYPRPVLVYNLTTEGYDSCIGIYDAIKGGIDWGVSVSPRILDLIRDKRTSFIKSGVVDRGGKTYDEDGRLKIGFCGRLADKKGIEFFPEVFSGMKGIELHIAGPKMGYESRLKILEKSIRQNGNVFKYHGYMEKPWELLKRLDVMLLLSKREGMPMMLAEAAMCGVPSITTPVGGIPYYFQDGKNALFVNRNNVKGIRQALLRFRDKRTVATRLGRNARKMAVKEFSIEGSVKSYESLFAKLIAERMAFVDTIGVRRNTGGGDIIMTEPAVRKIRRMYPNAKIMYQCDPRFLGLARLIGDGLTGDITRYDVNVDLKYKPADDAHAVKQFMKQIWCNVDMDISRMPNLLKRIEPKRDWDVGIHTTTDSPEKQWPVGRWVRLVDRLRRCGFQVYQIDQSPQVVGARKHESFTLADYVKTVGRCRLLITIDTVAQHAAAAIGVPTVVIWGKASSPLLTGYMNQENVVSRDKCKCWVTVKETLRRKDCPGRCIDSVSVLRVWKAARRILIREGMLDERSGKKKVRAR